MELIAVLWHKCERWIYFIIVSDITILIMIKTQKFEMIDAVSYPPYQCRIQSETVVLDSVIYFCYVHIDGNAISTANVIVVVKKIFFSVPQFHIYF